MGSKVIHTLKLNQEKYKWQTSHKASGKAPSTQKRIRNRASVSTFFTYFLVIKGHILDKNYCPVLFMCQCNS